MTDPYSMVNRTCSIKNSGTTLGKTWEQVNNILKAKSDLLLKSGSLTTRICLTRKYTLSNLFTFEYKNANKSNNNNGDNDDHDGDGDGDG